MYTLDAVCFQMHAFTDEHRLYFQLQSRLSQLVLAILKRLAPNSSKYPNHPQTIPSWP